MIGRSHASHRIKQRDNIELGVAERVGRLGIRHLLNTALNLGNKKGSLLGITRTTEDAERDRPDWTEIGAQYSNLYMYVIEQMQ